ncbi:Transcription initiation factor TFIIH subunit 1 [Fasciola gigantica]|uniref:Transcription initiation factor TFIIH subunit 1 n=1 Tax=Fasciola gigantica TaxID=46835 RepID=A0A504YJY6_FASGI|nr:Transcription initiation factor TFIIH subunit 1 [Fasciola gigantica]
MSKQKEDVLLMVKHVRYKKVDGTLYVNSGRLAWRNQTSDSFRISAAFEDIRVQRISPDQKEKVQLQLLMHNGESFTFQFADPAGRVKQLEMRNNVKEMLQRLLPKFKDKAQSELREKVRLLESNPDLLALYKELVVTGILSSDEFWARPEFSTTNNTSSEAPTQSSQRKSQGSTATAVNTTTGGSNSTGQISRSFQLDDQPQTVGVPSYLLSDIKPEADGANGIKYNLTHETINAIFRAYPTVRQRHKELVPDKLTEADFWIKFFQSHYFHRDRVQLPKEDIFADCAAQDERQLQTELRRSRRNRISAHLDLESLSDHELGIGYGTEIDPLPTVRPSESLSKSTEDGSNISANQLLLRRFNNHSILILKSLGSGDVASGLSCVPMDGIGGSVDQSSQSQTATTTDSARAISLKQQIYSSELTDDPEPPHFRLELASVSDYLEGPTSKEQGASTTRTSLNQNSIAPARPYAQSTTTTHASEASERCKSLMRSAYAGGRKAKNVLLTTMDAQLALADVSPGGCLVGGKRSDELKGSRSTERPDSVDTTGCRGVDNNRLMGSGSTGPRRSAQDAEEVDRGPALLNAEQARELSLLYASASELLRHFWACFPVTNPELAEKLDRIANSLTRFRVSKVAHFAASLDPTMGGSSGSLNSNPGSSVVGSAGSAVKNNSDPVSTSDDAGTRGTVSYRSRVTSHLESMLDAAQQKYAEWKTRRRR